jgi:SAM-dependent methyltransferase
MTQEELYRLAAEAPVRHGWDFAAMRESRDPVPWDYAEIVRRYLWPEATVLDVGTGGGERFLALADAYGRGIGTDASTTMIAAARENATRQAFPGRVSFEIMPAEALALPDASVDVALNRHAVLCAPEIARVLRPGGLFITQQVGARNTANICALFGCTVGGPYVSPHSPTPAELAAQFRALGLDVVCTAEYDVRWWIEDAASLLFWLQALPMPEDFAIERHWRQVQWILDHEMTPRGILTNEHRELTIVRKPADG